jgi:Ca2+-binding EF-hand superfamily protein
MRRAESRSCLKHRRGGQNHGVLNPVSRKMNVDADGFLHVQEFANFAAEQNKGVPLSEDDVAHAFRTFDISMDGADGRLSFGEVALWCQSVADPSGVGLGMVGRRLSLAVPHPVASTV